MEKKEKEFDWEKLLQKENLAEEEKRELCSRLMTADTRMERLIWKNFTAEDYYKVWRRRIGGGRIGGKACGLLAARKLIKTRLPELAVHMEEHHSFFVGSDVFAQFLEENDCMELWQHDRTKEEYYEENEELRKRILSGRFSKEISDALMNVVRYYGSTPIVVRSSSFLEDGFGNSFSGKYESIFCVNQGDENSNLEELKDAIRGVYASTTSPSAIEYRRIRKLTGVEERMALLIQRVEGQSYGTFYMPVAAGMGCSYNPYKWMENMNPDAGMLRMVMGLGTRAVERTPGDYPRLVGLDRARANLRTTIAERHKFSQRQVDVLDYKTNSLHTRPLKEVISALPEWQRKMVLSRDTDAERNLRQMGRNQKIYFADCQGMVERDAFIGFMKAIMKMLQREYGSPVDIEFAVSSPEEGKFKVNLLQCRPNQSGSSERIVIPKGIDSEILFDVRRTSMRRSKKVKIHRIVWVNPQKYYEYPHAKKSDVARKISEINHLCGGEAINMMLLVPGRIGTSSPELGVPVVYADISQFSAICEVSYSEVGYRPELSYGSHMFQDLVEADVYYGAINENSKTRIYNPKLLEKCRDLYPEFWPNDGELSEIIKIYDASQYDTELMLDMQDGRAVCRLGGING